MKLLIGGVSDGRCNSKAPAKRLILERQTDVKSSDRASGSSYAVR